LDQNWTPLLETSIDDIFVNRWRSGDKTIYTVLNMRHAGTSGRLFKTEVDGNKHFISLWYHEDIIPQSVNDKSEIAVKTEGWPESFSGTRNEGSVDCIAELPKLLKSVIKGDSLLISSSLPGKILFWKGDPSYETESREISVNSDTIVNLKDLFGYYEGKIVLQLIEDKRLKDEIILRIESGKPWLTSRFIRTEKAVEIVEDMVLIPAADFSYSVSTREDFIPYPEVNGISVRIDSFLIDKYPVTNAQYYDFISGSGYRPSDTTRYLRHWEYGIYKPGTEKYPVVYVSYDDIKAYAKWAGKRLPTQAEWQLAAQGPDKRIWPWGNDFHATLCNNAFGKSTPVDAFSKGASPFGVMDLVGNIWQVTNDMYFNGSYYFIVIRGGSHFRTDSSGWYIEGGPQPLDKTQIMLLISPGFDRSATVGFRCVKDIDVKEFKAKR
jgi:formylglycine-generating enzyme required for sulfatase activity